MNNKMPNNKNTNTGFREFAASTGHLMDIDAFELWTFTHPNVDHIARLVTFHVDECSGAESEAALTLFRQSEAKHAAHPGKHELLPDGCLNRAYDLAALTPCAPQNAGVRERFLTIRSERNTLPVGATRFIERITEDKLPDGCSTLHLSFEFAFIFVRPEFRGIGFGAALARARGRTCGQSVAQLTRLAAARGAAVSIDVFGQPLNCLGEKTLLASFEELELAVEQLRSSAARENRTLDLLGPTRHEAPPVVQA